MRIEFSGVSKSFDKRPVIRELSMIIESGEIVCLLGPSGSGKTTTIRLALGALKADSGTIRFGDISVPNLALSRKIGFMPQNDALYDDLTGENNLRFFGGLYRLGKDKMERRISEVLALTDLTDDRKKYVRGYSGGMKKRLSLAAALLHEPDALLLDEPTVGIDPVLRRRIWDQLKAIKAAGRTVVVSTHVMDEVSECDKAALIYGGRLIHFDAVEALLAKTEHGRIEELFFMAAHEKGGEAV